MVSLKNNVFYEGKNWNLGGVDQDFFLIFHNLGKEPRISGRTWNLGGKGKNVKISFFRRAERTEFFLSFYVEKRKKYRFSGERSEPEIFFVFLCRKTKKI